MAEAAAVGTGAVSLQIRRNERRGSRRHFSSRVARDALRSLYDELTTYPKPGLVSLVDSGSHADMDASTFVRSLFALRHYFRRIAVAGADGARFSELKRLGIEAESAMLDATGGVNTHRGAIFALGLLCAAAGRCHADGLAPTPAALRAVLLIHWGGDLAAHAGDIGSESHGGRVARRYQAGGARQEAALGFPSVFELALPTLGSTLAAGRSWRCARIDAIFTLMAEVGDTNVYYRGGLDGHRLVQQHARQFADRGGTARRDWFAAALACHQTFTARRLSPGGAADLLAAACFVWRTGGSMPA